MVRCHLKKKAVRMDMMEMTGPSKSKRELKSMQCVGGSLIAENFRASSMLPTMFVWNGVRIYIGRYIK